MGGCGFLIEMLIELLFLALASEGGQAKRGRWRRGGRRRHWRERRGKRGERRKQDAYVKIHAADVIFHDDTWLVAFSGNTIRPGSSHNKPVILPVMAPSDRPAHPILRGIHLQHIDTSASGPQATEPPLAVKHTTASPLSLVVPLFAA